MANPILDADILPLLGILLASGVLAGTLAGLFGVGGGVVLVPALLYAFDFLGYDPLFTTHMAVGTSLAIIIPTAISSAQSHYRKGSVDLFLVRKLMIPVSIGAVVGSVIADRVGGDLLKGLYAVIALFLALNLFMKKSIIPFGTITITGVYHDSCFCHWYSLNDDGNRRRCTVCPIFQCI